MWVAKFRVFDEENKISQILRQSKVKVYYYPVNNYIKNKRYYFVILGIIEGENKNKFFKELFKLRKAKTGRRVELLEIEEDFFVLITSHTLIDELKLFVRVAYNPALIHFQPVVFNEDGWEEWNIASLERRDIEELIKIGEKKYKIELLKFSKEKITNFGFLTIVPDLTEKQKKAIELAVKEGYFSYPRKIDVQGLAKKAGLSFSTFQAHLRKAENKLLSYITKKITS